MKRFVVAAVCMCVLGAGRVGAKPAKVVASNTARVTALEAKSDEVQQLMDVKLWEFDVRVPAGTKNSKQRLVLEMRRGQKSERLLALPLSMYAISGSKRMHVSIGLYPPDGDMMHSKKLKYSVQIRSYAANGKAQPSSGLSNFIDNPFDAMTATYPGNSAVVPQKDGSFLLFGGSKNPGTGSWSKRTIDDIFSHQVSAASFDTALLFAIR